ncbi:MAG TPA: carboxymuconolactone decarboxylase family protein [Acidimicrobiia bacterium]|nr:carboxymuconolactone decarboxylase family protein [Acidimicrobiia bacterium]
MSATGARIAPLPIDGWDDDAVAALRAAFGEDAAERLLSTEAGGPRMPNVLPTLLRHPALTGPFLAYNAVLLNAPTIEPRARELMILRVAWRTRSAYEWAQHVRIARSCGITAAEVDAVAHGAVADTWSSFDADLLTATDELLDDYRIDDDTWARLADHLDERQLIEVAFIVGTYTCLAMAFNSFGLELDPELQGTALPPPADTKA